MDSRLKKSIRRGLLFGAGLAAAIASAATFNLFSPATGILKGNSSTYVTTAAASTDVVGLFTGCSGVQYLGADGACHAAGASPGGSTNSVQYNNSGSLGGVSLAADTLLQGSAGAPQSVSVPNCGSSTQALSYATSTHLFGCQTISGGGGGTPANPTALVGLTAVNGVAATYMRSDASPPIDQSITPVWTGTHEFDGGVDIEQIASNVNSFQINGAAGTPGVPLVNISGSTTAGNSNGISVRAGTNSADFPLSVQNAANTLNIMSLHGDGGTVLGAPTGGDKGAGSINAEAVYVQGTAVPSFGILCSVNISLAGTGTPTVGGNRGCASPGVSRTSAGVYHITDTTISSAFGAYCSLNSATPFFFIIATTSSVIVDIYNTSGTLADPPSGASLVCMWGG